MNKSATTFCGPSVKTPIICTCIQNNFKNFQLRKNIKHDIKKVIVGSLERVIEKIKCLLDADFIESVMVPDIVKKCAEYDIHPKTSFIDELNKLLYKYQDAAETSIFDHVCEHGNPEYYNIFADIVIAGRAMPSGFPYKIAKSLKTGNYIFCETGLSEADIYKDIIIPIYGKYYLENKRRVREFNNLFADMTPELIKNNIKFEIFVKTEILGAYEGIEQILTVRAVNLI